MSVVVRPVSSWRDRREFVELPYRLHSTSAVWVPPLRLERHLFLMRSQNAFFSHGDAQLFLAWRDGRVVGRISAQYDDNFNAFHGNRWGMFGFLELEDAPDILPPLLEAGATWLRAHGRDRMIGPMDFTMNDECGVLIEGFERMPFIKQPWHPPYYAARCEEAGLAKAMDLLMYELVISDRSKILPVVFKLAERGRAAPRDHDPAHDTALAAAATWTASPRSTTRPGARTGASCPYSERDLDVYAQEMQLVFDRNWFMVAETADGRDGGDRDHDPGHQPGADEDEGAAAAVGLVALPAQGGSSTGFGSASSASSPRTSTRASRRRCTSSTSTPPRARRRSGARWAGSSRPTAT